MAGLSVAVILLCLLNSVFSQRMFHISGPVGNENNTCGDSFTLAPRSTENVTLVANGRLSKGFCEVTIGINNSQRCKRQICIQGAGTLTSSGIIFHITPTPGSMTEYRGPNYSELEMEHCFDAYSLFINISEPASVGHNFNFQLFLRPSCNDSNNADQIALSDADSRAIDTVAELERAWTLTTVYGAVTGVCLAFFFLIILFITYCYYRSYPYGNKKREKQKTANKKEGTTKIQAREMEEMKLLETKEAVGDSSGLGLSDNDVIDLEEGTSQNKEEPDKEDTLTMEKETKKVEENETNVEKKMGNDFVNVDLETPEPDESQKSASLDSD
ncbi:uncharacterized protein LOC133175846 [Saccostrea echinata]|uniref:uncharacterized protein LOC133175846 n=1 Tax=Saccostrea echinata TaxID=191078 RepID=UPI002A7F76CF|nr:uncharacterized protein LOC133175846 [Saccostrea echinata]